MHYHHILIVRLPVGVVLRGLHSLLLGALVFTVLILDRLEMALNILLLVLVRPDRDERHKLWLLAAMSRLREDAHLLVPSRIRVEQLVLASALARLGRLLGVLPRLLKVVIVDVGSTSVDARSTYEIRIPLLMRSLRSKRIVLN